MGHVRGCPVLRPVVVRSKTFILPMLAPSLPLLSRYSRRCSDPMTFIMVRMTDVLPCVVVSIGRLINPSPHHRSIWAISVVVSAFCGTTSYKFRRSGVRRVGVMQRAVDLDEIAVMGPDM